MNARPRSDPGTGVDAAPVEALVELVEATLRELRAGTPDLPAVLPASRLEQDLGLDSLARTELLQRVERRFGVELPEDTLGRTETVADLLVAVERSRPARARDAPVAQGGTWLISQAARVEAPAARAPRSPANPDSASTLLQALDAHVTLHPERTQVLCLVDGAEHPLSYRRLVHDAAAVAAGLHSFGMQPRQAVAIMLPTCPEYVGTYLGILRAGAIPVPIYPPARASQLEEHVLRHARILANAQTAMLVTVPEAIVVARLLQARVPGLRHVVSPQQLAREASDRPKPVPVRAEDIAFIQYTSGSTGQPKGVALTHANLIANIRSMAVATDVASEDRFVSWLPLYHDMGLIGAWLTGLVIGFPLVVMSPLAFLARPESWLWAVHRHRGTLTAAPNFAYELCLKRIDDADLARLDLSSLRLLFNGAEAVGPETVRRFAERFARCGLKPEAVAPVYGLAECCVGLLLPPLNRIAPIDSIEREPFQRAHVAQPARADDAHALRFVGCGRPIPGHEVRIVDDDGREVGERVEGRLEFRGPSATQGYFRNPAATARLMRDGWLDTGDRAYRAEDEIYITGRVKDIVIRGGRNLYPTEIEDAVGLVEGVRRGCVAVFGSPDPATGTERLVVLAEVRHGDAAHHAQLRARIGEAVLRAIGEPPDHVELAPPHTVLKTSSGKIRRAACRQLFESGRIAKTAPTAWRQMLHLALGALGPRLRSATSRAVAWLYGLSAWGVFGLLAVPTWILTAALRSVDSAWRLGHRAARALLALTATPLVVRGLEHLPAGPCVLVCNHGSYLDGMVLTAALPRPFAFVAKRELLASRVARVYLQRIGARFVERFDAPRGVEAADELVQCVRAGQSLAVFPEGTFVAAPGLLPFHLGAFVVAARTQVPIVPVTLHGTRDLLPAGRWWPRRAALEVRLHPPLRPPPPTPADHSFATAVRLRDAARAAIGERANEPTEAEAD